MPPKDKEQKEAPVAETKKYNTKAETMKAHLESQPKIRYTIPLVDGMPPDFTVNLNGHVMVIKTGVPTDLPEQVAAVLDDRMRSDGYLKKISESMMDNMRREQAG